MNIAVVVAGGVGLRTGNPVPKQFLTVKDIPIIIYTLKRLQASKPIDEIVVAVAEEWQTFIKAYAIQHGISKLAHIVIGGSTRHQTINNVISKLSSWYTSETKIVIVDGNRPMIPQHIISEAIEKAKKNVCTVALMPCYDSMYISANGITVEERADRNVLYNGQAPECAILSDLIEIYSHAVYEQYEDSTASLFIKYDKTVTRIAGSSKSFKITTQEDIDLFRAMVLANMIDEEI